MKMEVLPSNNSYCEDDNKNLEQLLEAFGSMVSLENIASAYCQAGRNVYTAGEILCNQIGSISSSGSRDELEGASSSSELSTDNFVDKSHVERHSNAPKQRRSSVSMGTVSGLIGREYSRTRPLSYERHTVSKPPKLNSTELPAFEMWSEHLPDGIATSETMKKDVEDFLFKMLGDGFKLDMSVIREVLGLCGYDVTKSMEKLLDLSVSTLDKNDDNLCTNSQKARGKSLEAEPFLSDKIIHDRGSAGSSEAGMFTSAESDLPKRDKGMYDLQKEVLNSLFSVPERVEEAPKRIIRPATQARRGRFGRLVVEPPTDTPTEPSIFIKPKVTDDEADENEECYNALRKANKEYLTTMKEYYKSATEAFVKGDRMLSEKLMEQGEFFRKKASEANDKSTQKLLETRDEEEEVSLDLHDYEPKEAVRLLKCHLISISGIPAFQHLKVLISNNENDTKRAARKKRIIELLENDSIKWIEEDGGKIILIRVDEINPKRLSFAKKVR